MPKITVIIPVFNKKRYLDQLAECLRTQTFEDYECLVIDDGSTDGSAEVCDAMAAADHRIQVFHVTNGGVSRARNIGLAHARGEYVTFIDADDGFSQDYLSNLHQCMEKSQADMVIGSHKKVWEHTDREELCIVPVHGLVGMEQILPQFATWQKGSGVFGFCWNKLMGRKLLEGVFFDPSVHLAEDFEFYLKIYAKVKNIYFDDKPNYRYLQEAENSSMRVKDSDIDYFTQLDLNVRYKRFLEKRNVLFGTNKEIVDRQIASYAYFVLFHGNMHDFEENFNIAHRVYIHENLPTNVGGIFERWIMHLVKYNMSWLVKISVKCYRGFRGIKRLIICRISKRI